MVADNNNVVVGEHAWTKLLDERDTLDKEAVIIKMSHNDNNLMHDYQHSNSNSQSSETSPLTEEEQNDHHEHQHQHQHQQQMNKNCHNYHHNHHHHHSSRQHHHEHCNGNNMMKGTKDIDHDGNKMNVNFNDEKTVQMQRKQTIFGTFHRHLRRSIKAVSESPGPITRYRQTRFSSRRVRKRVIFKHGDCNVVQGNVAKRRRRYLQDIFTTLVDAQWRWTLLVFALSFLISWAFFGVIWWTIAYVHGDLDWMYAKDFHPDALINQNISHTMCVTEVRSFTSAFLYSVETQHTIGYGNRFATEQCPEAIFFMCLQCITGVFIQAFMVGIVFAKLSRPKKRAQTLLFSRNAVICHRDGVPCLMFRVGDMRKSHIIEAHVRAQIIRKKVTKEGEVLPFYQQELQVGADGGEDRLMFIWPTTIVHKIDHNSPLYMLSASDMLKDRFEVVCMLEGVVESTGMTTQARSSYLPSEILWGHRFVNVVSFRKDTGEYEVDYTLFNNTYDVDTPLCSAKELDDIKREYTKNPKNGLERVLSAGLLQHIATSRSPSIDHMEPTASDESLDYQQLNVNLEQQSNNNNNKNNNNNNNNSINNRNKNGGKSPPTFTMGGSSIIPTITTTNYQSITEKTNSISNNNNNNTNKSLFNNMNNSNNNNNNISNNNNNNSNSNSNNYVCNHHNHYTNNNNNSTIQNTKEKISHSRRLSIKQDQLPDDSIC